MANTNYLDVFTQGVKDGFRLYFEPLRTHPKTIILGSLLVGSIIAYSDNHGCMGEPRSGLETRVEETIPIP